MCAIFVALNTVHVDKEPNCNIRRYQLLKAAHVSFSLH